MTLTCKDWLFYILENDLMNEPIGENGRLPGFMSMLEAAAKFNVGEATIKLWIQMKMLESIKIGDVIYIPAWVKDPREKGVE